MLLERDEEDWDLLLPQIMRTIREKDQTPRTLYVKTGSRGELL